MQIWAQPVNGSLTNSRLRPPFEGVYADSEWVLFGYNRDGKRRHEQMVIALIASYKTFAEA